MKPARILLLLVALIAGGLAAFLATRSNTAPEVITRAEVQQEPKIQVLVAARPIGVGERLGPETVQWQEWPAGAVRPEYITSERLPDAPAQLTGTVARFEIFTGEPVREAKLIRSDQGYLSAVLSRGMRAVSIAVTAESGAGGFIVPNDRVDVVLTRQSDRGETSETILGNVKVLAIGQRLGEVGAPAGAAEDAENAEAQTFTAPTIATLELDPLQAETIINSASVGSLSLVLRSIVDFGKKADPLQARAGGAIRIIRFGKENSVTAGTSQGGAADIASVQNAAATANQVLPGRSVSPPATLPIFSSSAMAPSAPQSAQPPLQLQ